MLPIHWEYSSYNRLLVLYGFMNCYKIIQALFFMKNKSLNYKELPIYGNISYTYVVLSIYIY